jgi:hypothetical protein
LSQLNKVVGDFAGAFKAVDSTAPQGKSRSRTYAPGIGPLTEEEAVGRALAYLKQSRPDYYKAAGPKRYPGDRRKCDLVIPSEWAIEFKLIRPYGDNGKEAEHWSENILHPYPGSTSSIGDCMKLLTSGFAERRAVIVFGYEHESPQIRLDIAVKAFEVIATEVWGIRLGPRSYAEFDELIHPCHQRGKVYGWEIMGMAGALSA